MTIVDYLHGAALLLAGISALLAMGRMRVGPTLLDRVVANDVLTAGALTFTAVLIVAWSRDDLALVLLLLALTGFITAVVAARFVTRDVVGDRQILTREEAEEQRRRRDAQALVDEMEEHDEVVDEGSDNT